MCGAAGCTVWPGEGGERTAQGSTGQMERAPSSSDAWRLRLPGGSALGRSTSRLKVTTAEPQKKPGAGPGDALPLAEGPANYPELRGPLGC